MRVLATKQGGEKTSKKQETARIFDLGYIYSNDDICYTTVGGVIVMEDQAVEGIIFNIQKFCLHDGPGIRTTIFMKGCPLRCFWCSNPESQNFQPVKMNDDHDSTRYSVDEVLQLCMQDQVFYEESGGGVTISGGEPLVQWQFVLSLLRKLKANDIHTAIDTTGCVQSDTFHQVIASADLLLFDLKHYASDKHKTGTGSGNGIIMDNLKYGIANGKEILLRIPVIPGFNDATEDAKSFSILLNELGILSVQLLPFHQFGDKKYELLETPYVMKGKKPVHAGELALYKEVFTKNGIDAFF